MFIYDIKYDIKWSSRGHIYQTSSNSRIPPTYLEPKRAATEVFVKVIPSTFIHTSKAQKVDICINEQRQVLHKLTNNGLIEYWLLNFEYWTINTTHYWIPIKQSILTNSSWAWDSLDTLENTRSTKSALEKNSSFWIKIRGCLKNR